MENLGLIIINYYIFWNILSMNYNKTLYQMFDIKSNLKEKSGKIYEDFNKENNKTNIKKMKLMIIIM